MEGADYHYIICSLPMTTVHFNTCDWRNVSYSPHLFS